jgi:hypothetical protein
VNETSLKFVHCPICSNLGDPSDDVETFRIGITVQTDKRKVAYTVRLQCDRCGIHLVKTHKGQMNEYFCPCNSCKERRKR